MKKQIDIKKIYSTDPQWYKKNWTLDIQNASWVEQTKPQIEFITTVLEIKGTERILDLACGFGRHSLELAKKGCDVVGVDITAEYIEEARRRAEESGFKVDFICSDIREVRFSDEFDVVLNLADGAIGYLESDEENLKIFDVITSALKPGGKHLMDVCNGSYAAKNFPCRHWELGNHSISLADFEWDRKSSRMFYGGLDLIYGEKLDKPEKINLESTRLYNLEELEGIFRSRDMVIRQAYGDYNLLIPASEKILQIQTYSQKL